MKHSISHVKTPPRCLLVGLELPHTTWPLEDSLNELAQLCDTAGMQVIGKTYQRRDTPHQRSYVGAGKHEEIQQYIKENDIQVLLTDDELSPNQHKHLEESLNIKVIDRTGLILEIFANRAKTAEAQLQVELAQLEYLLPRLTRLWTHLSRQTGGIGTKGPGETQLESDKRQIRKRMSLLKEKLNKIKAHRNTLRIQRHTLPTLTAALVGYTNAGKSTLLNQLTQSTVLAEDKLFATLDPTTRQYKLSNNETILLTDTVGFIQKLPHQLVSSFRATLEETIHADFLLHVVDTSSKQLEAQIETANALLKELGAEHIPKLMIFNKIDKLSSLDPIMPLLNQYHPYITVSALNKNNLIHVQEGIEQLLKPFRNITTFEIPYNRMDIVHLIHQHGKIQSESYENHITITAEMNKIIAEKLLRRIQKERKDS